jgi:hypothetical protein
MAYRIPDTLQGTTTPADVAAGKVKTIPIGHVDRPVHSFIVGPEAVASFRPGGPGACMGARSAVTFAARFPRRLRRKSSPT